MKDVNTFFDKKAKIVNSPIPNIYYQFSKHLNLNQNQNYNISQLINDYYAIILQSFFMIIG